MNGASSALAHEFRPKILERRARLQSAGDSLPAEYVNDLLAEIDSALERIENGSYGLCEVCHDSIEADRLERDPMVRFCLDHLNEQERKAHEEDLELAKQIQVKLLPPADMKLEGWETHYRYRPMGAVGGDYCELIASEDGTSLFFAVGDVAGKGVAASLLMTHLSAIFRSLLSLDMALEDVVSRANRLFCESTAAEHYATLVCGRTTAGGVTLCNAGHCTPLVVRQSETERVEATGLPLGLFANGRYTVREIGLGQGEALVLYSDGITEAQDADGNEFEVERLTGSLEGECGGSRAMAEAVLRDVAAFRGSRAQQDDMTLLIVRRAG